LRRCKGPRFYRMWPLPGRKGARRSGPAEAQLWCPAFALDLSPCSSGAPVPGPWCPGACPAPCPGPQLWCPGAPWCPAAVALVPGPGSVRSCRPAPWSWCAAALAPWSCPGPCDRAQLRRAPCPWCPVPWCSSIGAPCPGPAALAQLWCLRMHPPGPWSLVRSSGALRPGPGSGAPLSLDLSPWCPGAAGATEAQLWCPWSWCAAVALVPCALSLVRSSGALVQLRRAPGPQLWCLSPWIWRPGAPCHRAQLRRAPAAGALVQLAQLDRRAALAPSWRPPGGSDLWRAEGTEPPALSFGFFFPSHGLNQRMANISHRLSREKSELQGRSGSAIWNQQMACALPSEWRSPQ
jgi:hypothetical protein